MRYLFFFFLLLSNWAYSQQIDIIWGKLVRATAASNGLVKSQNGQIASAKSENILNPNTNGWAEFKVTATQSEVGFGFMKSTDNNNEVDGEIDFANLDYSFHLFNNNKIKIYSEGGLIGEFGTYAVNNVLRIERFNNQIKFYKNSILLTTITSNSIPSKTYIVNAIIKSNNASLALTRSSFIKPLTISSSVVDVHCQSATNTASIIVTLSGGVQPYTYLWSNGNTTSSLNNIKSGEYSLVISDALNNTIKKSFTVLNCVDWTDLVGVSLNGTILTKTVTTGWDNASAVSENVLQGGKDGYMQFYPANNAKSSAIGLTFMKTSNNYTTIDYAFLITNRKVFIFSSGKLQGNFGTIKNTDLLKIERIGNVIYFYKNGVTLYKEITKPEYDLVVDASFNRINDVFADVKASFFQKPSLTAIVKNYEQETVKGSVELLVKGGYAPYSFAWGNIKIPTAPALVSLIRSQAPTLSFDSAYIYSKIDSLRMRRKLTTLQPGFYPVTVYDQVNDSINIVALVGTKISWQFLDPKGIINKNTPIPSRKLDKTIYVYDNGENLALIDKADPAINFAVSENIILPTYDNYIEFTVPSILDASYVGLIDRISDIGKGTNESFKGKMYFEFTGKEAFNLYFRDQKIYSSTFKSGDVFSFSTDSKDGSMRFYQNNKEIAQAKFTDIIKGSVSPEDNGMFLKVILNSTKAQITNVVMKTFPPTGGVIISLPKYSISATVKDVTCGNLCAGSIDAVGFTFLMSNPVRYELYNATTNALVNSVLYAGGVNHGLFTNVCVGKYYVKFYYNRFGTISSFSSSLTTPFEVAYMPDWAHITQVNVSSTDNSLTRFGSTVNIWDAGASSLNTLKNTDSGWIEWTGLNATQTAINAVGFSNNDLNTDIASINYGVGYFGFNNFLNLYVLTHNNTMINALSLPSPQINTYPTSNAKFRLEKIAGSGQIKFLINGTQVGQFTGVTSQDFILDASLKFFTGTITHPRVSFGCSQPPVSAVPKKELDGSYYQTYFNKLQFTTDGDYSITSLNYSIYDYSRVSFPSLPITSSTLNNGDNRYEIDITTLISGYYVLELLNQKKEKLVLRFKK